MKHNKFRTNKKKEKKEYTYILIHSMEANYRNVNFGKDE